MERLTLQAYDTESLRNTILKHEEIFKQQVNELHHLYRVQKELMSDLKNKHRNSHHPSPGEAATETTSRRTVWSSPSTNPRKKVAGSSSGSDREQWSAGDKRFDLNQCTEEDYIDPHGGGGGGGPVLSWPDDGSEVELTLSIGSSQERNKRRSAVGCIRPPPPTPAIHSNRMLLARSIRPKN